MVSNLRYGPFDSFKPFYQTEYKFYGDKRRRSLLVKTLDYYFPVVNDIVGLIQAI